MSDPRIGVYPGTFDPITNGHTDIIRRAAKLVDHQQDHQFGMRIIGAGASARANRNGKSGYEQTADDALGVQHGRSQYRKKRFPSHGSISR